MTFSIALRLLSPRIYDCIFLHGCHGTDFGYFNSVSFLPLQLAPSPCTTSHFFLWCLVTPSPTSKPLSSFFRPSSSSGTDPWHCSHFRVGIDAPGWSSQVQRLAHHYTCICSTKIHAPLHVEQAYHSSAARCAYNWYRLMLLLRLHDILSPPKLPGWQQALPQDITNLF
jgi:hypothetical protein